MPKCRVPISQLQLGMYVELELGWNDHPFLFSAFKLKQDKQIRILRGLGLVDVLVDPARSEVPVPQAVVRADADATSTSPPEHQAALEDISARKAQLKARRERAQRCEKSYRRTLTAVKDLMKNLGARPVQAVEAADALVGDIVKSLLSENEVVLQLMNEKGQDESSYYHMLNVSVLSMMLGRQAGLPPQDLKDLGMGALFHDIGQQKIPSQILRKREPLNRAEQAFFEQHPQYGADMAGKLPTLSDHARAIIAQHHETLLGTGYPKRLGGAAIHRLARIVAIVNAYDNLVNPLVIENALTPHEALGVLFKERRDEFDEAMLALFVKHMGVYPPGTVVQLSNGMIGMVLSVNSNNLLCPSLVLYNPEVPKNEAIIFDLADDPDVTVSASLRPAALAPEVYDYLSPRTRISYYIEGKAPGKET